MRATTVLLLLAVTHPLRVTYSAEQHRDIELGAFNRNASHPLAVSGSCTVVYQGEYCQNRWPHGKSGAFFPGLQANVTSVAACWALASEHAECGDEIVSNAPATAGDGSTQDFSDALQCFCIQKGETCRDPTPSTGTLLNSVYKCRRGDKSPAVNLLLLADGKRLEPPETVESIGQFVPLYPTQGGDRDELSSVGFHWTVGKTSTLVTSYATDGSVRWNVSVPHNATSNVSIGGGFDFDSDGIPDLSLVYHSIALPASSCGRYPMGQSDLALMRGATGELVALSGLLPKNEQADLCWDFREPSNPVQTKQCNETHHCVYPTQQWTAAESPIWGNGSPVLIFSPTYSQWLYQLKWNPSNRQMERHGKLKFPSCPLDSKHVGCADSSTAEPYEAYDRAQPNAFYALGETSSLCAASPRNWTKCTINPHYANGLIITPTGDNRTVSPRTIFFTSSRVVQYALDDFNPKQLLADFPFLTDNRTDIVGRDYGLVAQDPAAPDLVAAVFGTSVATVLQDVLYKRETCNVSGTLGNEWSDCTDAWGGIERHVTLYNTASNVLVDKFFSLAHDPSRSVPFQLFENRTAYAALLHVPQHQSRQRTADPILDAKPSRVAYNVYKQGAWHILVTDHGSLETRVTFKDEILWDMRDLDGDGEAEWVTSPVDGYWPQYQTHLSHWDESSWSLKRLQKIPGVPYLLGGEFRKPGRSLGDTSVATVDYNSSLQLLTYLEEGGAKVALTPVQAT